MTYPYNQDWPQPIVYNVSPWDLRSEFNDAGYYTGSGRVGVQPGILMEVIWSGMPAPESNQQANCESQMVYYSRDGSPLGIVHRYLNHDGTLGASQRPDPKWLAVRGDGTWVADPGE